MKHLGILVLFTVLFAPTFAHAAEKVTCQDEDARYTVQFHLDGEVATELLFKDGEREIASYDRVEGSLSRFFKRYSYEFSLGGLQYFDLIRRKDASQFKGYFLFGVNPLRAEINVICQATAL